MPKILELEQGSPEWLAHRKRCITSTDIAVIMGVHPKKTPFMLWQEKLDLREPEKLNPAMLKGHKHEPIFRDWFNEKYKKNCVPVVIESDFNERFISSLDGYDLETETLLEVKWGREAYEMLRDLKESLMPTTYEYQIQWHMYVARHYKLHYVAGESLPEKIQLLIVYEEEELTERMEDAALEFLNYMDTMTPPPLTERDHIDRTGDKYLEELLNRYEINNLSIKSIEDDQEMLREKILEYCEKKNTFTKNGKVTRVISKGRVDYDIIPELKGIDLDKYRKPSVESYKITF